MEPVSPSVSSKPIKSDSKMNVSIDLRIIVAVLLAIIVAMLIIWKPWHHPAPNNARTVTVTGSTTLKATPDEYVFSPSYEFSNADKATAIAAANAKASEITAQLKTLGVSDAQIATNINGYQNSPIAYTGGQANSTKEDNMYRLDMTITMNDKVKTQKVQDYLTTTDPTGSVTPYASFSQTLQKQLESKARGAATTEARSKADQSANNLGFKVGDVKSVDDSSGFGGGIQPIDSGAINLDLGAKSATTTRPPLAVQPGQNDLSYSVTVTYYIR